MKKPLVLLLLILTACGGSLSDEQRRQMREKMEMNKIVRVTEAEILERAFAKGRETVRTLDSLKGDSTAVQTFLKSQAGKVHFLKPGASNAMMLEQQLIEAYLADPSGTFQDNVQEKRNARGGYDSLLYTKPVTEKMKDGTEQLKGVWNIWLTRKELVIDIGKNQ